MDYFKHQTALVGENATIGKDTRIWAFTNIEDGAQIGSGCNICDGCFIEKGAVIGNNVTIKNQVAIFDGVTIEDDAFIGTNTTFINDRHPRIQYKDSWQLERTVVGKGASIGSSVTILCGIHVGKYAFVGAGSVVTHNVENHGLVYGNPAKFHGLVCYCGKRIDQDLRCSCGLEYHEREDGLHLNE